MLSPPFTPPEPFNSRVLPYMQTKQISEPPSKRRCQPETFSPVFIKQIARILDCQVLSLTIIARTSLYHVLQVQITQSSAILLRLYTHHATPAHALAALIESLVQDCEDQLLTVPFDLIRQHSQHLSPLFSHSRPSQLLLVGDPHISTYTTRSARRSSKSSRLSIIQSSTSLHRPSAFTVPSSAIHQPHAAVLWADSDTAAAFHPGHHRHQDPFTHLQQLFCDCCTALYAILNDYQHINSPEFTLRDWAFRIKSNTEPSHAIRAAPTNKITGANQGSSFLASTLSLPSGDQRDPKGQEGDNEDAEITARRRLTTALKALSATKYDETKHALEHRTRVQ